MKSTLEKSRIQLILEDNKDAIEGTPIEERIEKKPIKELALTGDIILSTAIAFVIASNRKKMKPESSLETNPPPLIQTFNQALHGSPNGANKTWQSEIYPEDKTMLKIIVNYLHLLQETKQKIEVKAQHIKELENKGIQIPEKSEDVISHAQQIIAKPPKQENLLQIKDWIEKDIKQLEGMKKHFQIKKSPSIQTA